MVRWRTRRPEWKSGESRCTQQPAALNQVREGKRRCIAGDGDLHRVLGDGEVRNCGRRHGKGHLDLDHADGGVGGNNE